MSEETISKVVFYGDTLIDLTNDTVTPSQLYKNAIAHAKDGSIITGTAEITVDGTMLIIPEGFVTVS